MRNKTMETDSSNPKLARIKYEDGSTYHGEIDENWLKKGYGRLYNKDGQLIEAGEWIDDECFRKMSDEQLESEMKY
ncbi:MAG: hypothetical protein QM786_10575 [Breznakibacter sp.]